MERGGRKPEEAAGEIDVCRNVEGARECTVDLTGCVWMGSKTPGATRDKLPVVFQVVSGVGWVHRVRGLKTSSEGVFFSSGTSTTAPSHLSSEFSLLFEARGCLTTSGSLS